MSSSMRPAWLAHGVVVGTTLAVGLIAALSLGTGHAHGLFSVGFFLLALALFWGVYAAITTALVWKWGRSLPRALAIHALVLVVFPACFAVVAAIVA